MKSHAMEIEQWQCPICMTTIERDVETTEIYDIPHCDSCDWDMVKLED